VRRGQAHELQHVDSHIHAQTTRRNDMPNYCYNRLRVEGPDEELDNLVIAVDAGGDDPDDRFSFEKILPVPRGADEGELWGTTSLYDLKVERTRGELFYEFESSWDPPCELIHHLARSWPGLVFELVYVEPCTGRFGSRYFERALSHRWSDIGLQWSNDDSEMRDFLESEWPELARKWWGDDREGEVAA
jgi:hypothetical protein